MCCPTGDDLNEPNIVEVTEPGDDTAVESSEVFERL